MPVSSVLQQYLVDDLLLVAIDIRHHNSHRKIVLERKLFYASFRAWDLLLALAPKWPYSVPARLWFGCQLLSGIQLVRCWNRRSLHRGTMITAHPVW